MIFYIYRIEANPLGEFSTAPIEEYLNTSSGEPTANNAAIATSATLESGVNAWRYARVQEKVNNMIFIALTFILFTYVCNAALVFEVYRACYQ